MDPITNLYKLRTLLRLFETSSFSAAGRELGITQSAVSQQIKDLETQFGVPLVNRNDRPVRPTEAGELLMRYSHEIFGRIEEMERRVTEIRDAKAGKIIIGASTSVGSYLLPDLLERFTRRYPAVEITARISPRALVYDDIKMSRTDFAVVLASDPPPSLSYNSLRTEQLVFVCSPKHPLAKKKQVKLPSITKERFVTAGQNSDYVVMSNELLKTRGIHRYPLAIELDSMEAVKRAIGLNMGIGFLPLLGVEKEIRRGEICRIRVEGCSVECTLALVYRPGKFFTPAMTNLVTFCRSVLIAS
jgi:DNA-binding transcriptional LysR family regulator